MPRDVVDIYTPLPPPIRPGIGASGRRLRLTSACIRMSRGRVLEGRSEMRRSGSDLRRVRDGCAPVPSEEGEWDRGQEVGLPMTMARCAMVVPLIFG
jgi:hypothetical protein